MYVIRNHYKCLEIDTAPYLIDSKKHYNQKNISKLKKDSYKGSSIVSSFKYHKRVKRIYIRVRLRYGSPIFSVNRSSNSRSFFVLK